jgi:hypothetical protein
MTNGGLELDQGVSLVVRVIRAGLAACAKVNIVAHGALVANAEDVAVLAGSTEGAVAANANVNRGS